MALRFAIKLINPTRLPRESEGTDREARSKKAAKLMEANQAANRAKANIGRIIFRIIFPLTNIRAFIKVTMLKIRE
ncbi:MAG: hypothetical protein H6Q41_1358 [Deltaproteobacteria bacterium]|nr:hypothetical protein [Deltaproteobacteria bacterium]